MTAKKVLFLLPYPLYRAPSQRFRVENLLHLLDDAKIEYTLAPFLSEETWQILYKNGSLFAKGAGIAKSFFKRKLTLAFKAYQYDYIFIHREAAPLGPPIFEWFLAKVLNKKIIYDFDDAIWIPNTSAQNKMASLIKSFWKVKYICKWSYKVAAGNAYLCNYARKSKAKNITLLPTVVNTITRYNIQKLHEDKKLVVGWTGSHSTLKFLDEIIPLIAKLQKQIPFTFLVIADKKPNLNLEDWEFRPWNEKTEIEDLLQIDIGIMPLINDTWSEGKCGFKLIQYLALGIPAVANSVGVNKFIIDHHKNGYLADTESEWENSILDLLTSKKRRSEMGNEGRKKIVSEYSIAAQKDKFLQLFS